MTGAWKGTDSVETIAVTVKDNKDVIQNTLKRSVSENSKFLAIRNVSQTM
jgi:hypothetical protein